MSFISIPPLGLGVYKVKPGSSTYSTVLSALKLGYRHIDTAQFYGNEEDVGKAVRDSGLLRSEIFVTSKFWTMQTAPAGQTEDGFVVEQVKKSLALMQLDYLDLMLLHSPHGDRFTRWRGLETCVDLGLCRFIGVSNFGVEMLQKLLAMCRIKPLVNQIEVHVFLQRRILCQYCKEAGVLVEAYSPLAKATDMKNATLVRIAQECNRTVAQVMLRFLVEQAYIVLPKSESPSRQAENANIFDFELSDKQRNDLLALDEGKTTGWDPTTMTE